MRNEKEIPDFVKVNGLGSLTLKSSNMAAVSIRKRNEHRTKRQLHIPHTTLPGRMPSI